MNQPIRFDPHEYAVGIGSDFTATMVPDRPDPQIPFAGAIFGVAHMTDNSPHGGEMHPDGDEVLYLVSGHIRVVFLASPEDDIEVRPGEGLIVPQGMWHRVDILAPSEIAYMTPGPNSAYLPLPDST